MVPRIAPPDVNINLYSSLNKLSKRKENFMDYPGYAKNALPYFVDKHGLRNRKTYTHTNGRVEVVSFKDGTVMYLISNPKKKNLVEKVVVYYNNGDKFDEIIGLQIEDPKRFIREVRKRLRSYVEDDEKAGKHEYHNSEEKRVLVIAKRINSDVYDYVILKMTHRNIRRILLPTISKIL